MILTMVKKNYLTLDDEFIQYCKLNNIDDVQGYAKKVFNIGFTSIKYPKEPIVNQQIVVKPIEPIVQENKATKLYDE